MTDLLEPTARCLACDTPVIQLIKADVVRLVECAPSEDGEFAYLAGRLKELPIGAMTGPGCMRFADHARACKSSLKPEPKTVPTRDLGRPRRQREDPDLRGYRRRKD